MFILLYPFHNRVIIDCNYRGKICSVVSIIAIISYLMLFNYVNVKWIITQVISGALMVPRYTRIQDVDISSLFVIYDSGWGAKELSIRLLGHGLVYTRVVWAWAEFDLSCSSSICISFEICFYRAELSFPISFELSLASLYHWN